MKKALITGVTGQDGMYLSEFLLEKGYEVHGLIRRTSQKNARAQELSKYKNMYLHSGDMTDSTSLVKVLSAIRPDEIYNLAAMSHVGESFKVPESTADIDAIGPLRILEAVRYLGIEKSVRFYQASTSELFGLAQEVPQKETTPFYPRSPYAIAKLYAYWITVNYRESYGMFACNGIMFNHESPRRGEIFVTRKITKGLARVFHGCENILYLGNLDAKRDWGHAKDYVKMQWLMLQQEKPQDFVIASGRQHSVREFVELAASFLGVKVIWIGTGLNEKGVIKEIHNPKIRSLSPGDVIIAVNPEYFRPAEVESLVGDITKAKKVLNWSQEISFPEMVREMIMFDWNEHEKLSLRREESRFFKKIDLMNYC